MAAVHKVGYLASRWTHKEALADVVARVRQGGDQGPIVGAPIVIQDDGDRFLVQVETGDEKS